MKTHRNRALRQKRRRVPADDGVRVIDAEDEERLAVSGGAAILARGLTGGEFIRAERVLGTKIARADAVGAAEKTGCFARRERGQRRDGVGASGILGEEAGVLVRLAERDTNVARERI